MLDSDLRDTMNRLLDLAYCLRRMESDATANLIGRLDLPELHGRALQAFDREGVAGFLVMCPEGDMPGGSNVFLDVLDRSARVQRGATDLMPLNWADVLIRVHRNVDAAQKRRNESRGRDADIVPDLGGKGRKKSTSPGGAQTNLLGALLTWHQYGAGTVGNWAAVGVRELARIADVIPGSATNFFNKHWGDDKGENGHDRYKVACAHKRILDKLRELNGDSPPREFRNSLRDDLYLGREDDHDADED
ncbi:MAG: hypothetical protein DCC68_15510 [Planctomycetota bacterium]|nr:MAG: hypothetical protein DCC68_15510 [Planctomycetota bacterium]